MSGVSQRAAIHFIVNYSGKYYLTQELWEFDPEIDKGSLQPSQVIWLDQIQALYAGGDPVDGAVHVSDQQVCEATQINSGGGSGTGKK